MNEEALPTYLSIIQTHYSSAIKKEDVEVLTGGYAHTVLKIRDQVFRFPKTTESELNQAVEQTFSKYFAKISPVHTPIIHNHKDMVSRISYQTCEFVSGIPFTKELAATLSHDELVTIAQIIGKFLTQLHTVPIDEVKNLVVNSANTAEEYAKYFLDIIAEDKKVINSLLTPAEWAWVDKNTAIYYELSQKHPFPLKVTHADLLPKHILIDEKTHSLNGIIDFSVKIADSAHDFRYFDRYPEVFLKTVLDNYPIKDAFFEERRKFHARDFLVGHLYLVMKANEQEEKETYLKEFHEYIATNPLE